MFESSVCFPGSLLTYTLNKNNHVLQVSGLAKGQSKGHDKNNECHDLNHGSVLLKYCAECKSKICLL